MHVDLMRWIDYRVGVPLCFILSFFNKFIRVFGRRKKRVKKILFIELSEMGSTILAHESMQRIKKMYPGSKNYFLIFKENADSLRIMNTMPDKRILTISNKNFFRFCWDTFKMLIRLRMERFDIVLDLELFSRFTAMLTYFSGAPVRVGYNQYHQEGLYRGSLHTHGVLYNPYLHISENFMALVMASAESSKQRPLLKKKVPKEEYTVPKFVSSKEEQEKILNKLKMYCEITKKNKLNILNTHASEFLMVRRWPLRYYIKLAKDLLKDKKNIIILTGVGGATENARKIISALGKDRIIDLTDKTTFDELMHLMNVSDVIVTNDSGPGHFAAMTDIHIVVFFGPETPDLYSPISKNMKVFYSGLACSPCVSSYNHRKSACNNNVCLQVIKPDVVYEHIKSYLKS